MIGLYYNIGLEYNFAFCIYYKTKQIIKVCIIWSKLWITYIINYQFNYYVVKMFVKITQFSQLLFS